MDESLDFQPSQILFLEHTGTRLYAEVIQVVVSRRLCWVRPLLLVVFPSGIFASLEPVPLTDLRSCADLIWPITLFQPALDTEVMPLLAMLSSDQPELIGAAHTQLNQFVYQLWQAHKNAFQV